MQKRSSFLIILIAIICGAAGIYFVSNYVSGVKETFQSERILKQVVVAAQNIPENTTVTNDMVQISNVPAEYVLPQSFTDMKDVVGAMTTTGIVKGEQIVQGRITKGENKSSFSYGIPKEKRAISIGIDQISGVSGLIRPKDKVDVLATLTVPEDHSGSAEGQAVAIDGEQEVKVEVKVSWNAELEFFQKVARKLLEGRRIVSFDGKNITFTLFQNVEVLAIGSTVNKPVDAETTGLIQTEGGNSREQEARTVTLCLGAEEAELITNVERTGFIKFDLRNPGDDEIVELKPIIEYKLKDILKEAAKNR